ncbi:hypothetical protein GCM10010840_14780 [Deinococcus aerolatus]|uniref:NrS-1 polymerase-like HBD domain-containing protein n=1 Tax=Deinococcus aerolatus TaxID=522487 RepID=A0ABQ2G741_9DEIO|nr:hypothetical protein [Deinococcus aerolatus]GGL77933.1 hypothetical protein GCM10010840_14780 [Deinococcus aerolatus]
MTGSPADRLRAGWPEALHARRLYLPYQLRPRASGRQGKVPVRWAGRRWYPADARDSRFRLTLAGALLHLEAGAADGVGVVLDPQQAVVDGWPLVAADLDHVFRPGQPLPAATQQLVDRLASYTEVSRSGSGLHVVVGGRVPGNRRAGSVELIASGFLALTGHRLPGTPPGIGPRQTGLDALVAGMTAPRPGSQRQPSTSPADAEVLRRLRAGPGAAKFACLFDHGDLGLHGGDHSRADAALLGQLSYHTSDPQQLARLFAQSALFRPARWHASATHDGRTCGDVSVAFVLGRKGDPC